MGVQVTRYVKNDETGKYDTVVTTEYVGQVVGTGSTYIGDGDSNFFQVIFDYETATFKNVGGGYTPVPTVIDGTEEMLAAYEATKAAARATAQASAARRGIADAYFDAIREAATPRKGKTVLVVKGRKVPKGTVGVVKVAMDGQWGRRVLMTLADGTEVWTAETNVEVIEAVATEEVAA